MCLKKLGRALLFPHISIMIVLVPVSVAFLVYSMVALGTESAWAIMSYLLSAYTLAVWCFKIPHLVGKIKSFTAENKYVKIWRSDARVRVSVSLYGSLIFNIAYALLQLGMGFRHQSFWFFSLAGYYLSLSVMRFFLVRYTTKHRSGEKMLEELKKYRTCGIAFLIMNLALSLMIFFMVYWNRTFNHHEVTAIALSAYTFTSFTLAVVNIVRYRKYNNPVYSASKAISLAASCVSMLILESTLMTAFGKGTMSNAERRILLGVTGGVISAFIIIMAVYMIVRGTKQIKQLESKE